MYLQKKKLKNNLYFNCAPATDTPPQPLSEPANSPCLCLCLSLSFPIRSKNFSTQPSPFSYLSYTLAKNSNI